MDSQELWLQNVGCCVLQVNAGKPGKSLSGIGIFIAFVHYVSPPSAPVWYRWSQTTETSPALPMPSYSHWTDIGIKLMDVLE